MKIIYIKNFFKTLCQKICKIFPKSRKVSPIIHKMEDNPFDML